MAKQKIQTDTIFREIHIENHNEELRTVEATIATEYPALRQINGKNVWEVLDHSNPDSMIRERIDTCGLPFLKNHNNTEPIGKALDIWQENGKTRARLFVSETEPDAWQKIKDGIYNISLGYIPIRMYQDGIGENGYPIMRTIFKPTEITATPIPLDPYCTIDLTSIRSNEGAINELEIEMQDEITTPSDTTKQVSDTKQDVENRSLEVSDKASIKVIAEAPIANQEQRISAMRMIGEKFGANDIAERYIQEGRNAEELLTEIQESTKRSLNNMELTNKELQRYSFGKAAFGAMTGDLSKASFEMGLSREMGAKQSELIIPHGVLYGRDLTAGNGAQAGDLIENVLRGDLFSASARDNPAVVNMGVRVMPGVTSTFDIPLQVNKMSATMKTENGTLDQSDTSVALKQVVNHRLGAWARVSKTLLMMNSIINETFVASELRKAINEKIDQQFFYGDGTGQNLTGLFHTVGVNQVELGANGDVITYEDIVALETAVETNNYHGSKYVFNSKVRGALKTTRKDAGSGLFLLDSTNQLNGYDTLTTNVLKSDLSKGTGTNLSPVVFGDFSETFLFLFGQGIALQINPFSEDREGFIRLVSSVEADVVFRRPEAISAIVDAKV